MIEQAGIYKVSLIESKELSYRYFGNNISEILATGAVIDLENNQLPKFTLQPQRDKNNKLKFSYNLEWNFFNFSKENKALINQVKKSIYGWVAKIEFYNGEIKIITSPLRFNNSVIDNNISNSYNISISNIILGAPMSIYDEIEAAWILENGEWEGEGVWTLEGEWLTV